MVKERLNYGITFLRSWGTIFPTFPTEKRPDLGVGRAGGGGAPCSVRGGGRRKERRKKEEGLRGLLPGSAAPGGVARQGWLGQLPRWLAWPPACLRGSSVTPRRAGLSGAG